MDSQSKLNKYCMHIKLFHKFLYHNSTNSGLSSKQRQQYRKIESVEPGFRTDANKYIFQWSYNQQILYIIILSNQDSMSELDIVINPVTLLQMANYFKKHYIKGNDVYEGATFGLIYAEQVQLKYHISLAMPLGTNQQTAAQLLSRYKQYETLRLTRSKSTVNFYEQYTLLGVYLLHCSPNSKNQFERVQTKKLQQISIQLMKQGYPYALIVPALLQEQPILFRNLKQTRYQSEIKKNDRLCMDSLHSSNSNQLEVLNQSIKKKMVAVGVFNQKIKAISEKLNSKEVNPEALRKLDQLLNDYDRITTFSHKNKSKAIQSMNYSVITGIVIDRLVNN